MTQLLTEKLSATVGILVLTLACCCVPWFLGKKWRKSSTVLSILNCVAGGVVLGAFLLHMVPDMLHSHHGHDHGHGHKHDHKHDDHHHHGHNHAYPIGPLFAGISFLFLFSIDRLFLSHAHCENGKVESKKGTKTESHTHAHHQHSHNQTHLHSHDGHCSDHNHSHCHKLEIQGNENTIVKSNKDAFTQDTGSSIFGDRHEDCHEADIMGGCHMEGIASSKSHFQAYMFIFALSIHSLLEGLGIADKNSEKSLYNFLIGIVFHKWLEAFAFGCTVMKARFPFAKTLSLLVFYTILTPLGILAGIYLESLHDTSDTVSFILNGLAAGSFLFVSCIEMIPPEFHTKESSSLVKFVALCSGFGAMALIANFHA